MMSSYDLEDELAELVEGGVLTVLPDIVITTPPSFPAVQCVSGCMFRIWPKKGNHGLLVLYGAGRTKGPSKRQSLLGKILLNSTYGEVGAGHRGPPAPGEFVLGGVAESTDDKIPPLENVPT